MRGSGLSGVVWKWEGDWDRDRCGLGDLGGGLVGIGHLCPAPEVGGDFESAMSR